MDLERTGRPLWPPLLLVGTLATGAALQRMAPLRLLPEDSARHFALPGWMLIVAALLLEAAVVFVLRRVDTADMAESSADRLITDGPFLRSRNPTYVGHLSLLIGLGLLQANGWWLVLVPVFAALLYCLAVRPEERELEARFGAEYRGYCARVRRWM
jgi:protein-S-isoprenylcysteine O-methyltransferase Ste14